MMAALNRSEDRPWVRGSVLMRAGVSALALLYVLLSLNPADFKSMFPSAHPQASVAGSSESRGAVARDEAIPVPGASDADAGSGTEHKCCCKHVGGICEMGCCAGNDIAPNELCYRMCGGKGASSSALIRLDEHLAPAEIRFHPLPDRNAAFAKPSQKPLTASRQPPEKVPIA